MGGLRGLVGCARPGQNAVRREGAWGGGASAGTRSPPSPHDGELSSMPPKARADAEANARGSARAKDDLAFEELRVEQPTRTRGRAATRHILLPLSSLSLSAVQCGGSGDAIFGKVLVFGLVQAGNRYLNTRGETLALLVFRDILSAV